MDKFVIDLKIKGYIIDIQDQKESELMTKKNEEKSFGFSAIIGYKKEIEEFNEVRDFLLSPKKFSDVGARAPKGIILSGPPGTGKTMLSKAMAHETNVPFRLINPAANGNRLCEHIQEVFKQARNNPPVIIFIDEIDRMMANDMDFSDENQAALNQLLVEMDGFESNKGIVVIAATNKPFLLDHALTRPGRFDRSIQLGLPDLETRQQILEHYSKSKILSSEVNLSVLATKTSNMSGADLENLMNEAALLSVRDHTMQINHHHLEQALNRHLLKDIERDPIGDQNQRLRIAYHEAGHALVSILQGNNGFKKVTLKQNRNIGGFAYFSDSERVYKTEQDMRNAITGLLAGRASEYLVYRDYSTLAKQDLKSAMKIAMSMIVDYGMSKLSYIINDPMMMFNLEEVFDRDIIEQILFECYNQALNMLSNHLDDLEEITKALVERDTLMEEDIIEIINSKSNMEV